MGTSGNSIWIAKLDPALSTLFYSSYLGQDSSGGQLAVDASGNAYVVGQASSGFPVTSGAIQSSCAGGCGTLAKLNPSASGAASLLYATYLGGTSVGTTPAAVAVDSSQNVYISGFTASGFPEMNALQPCAPTIINGFETNAKGFVAEVNAAGALAFSTCLGNSPVTDVVVNSSGIAYVTGSADATLPLTNPIEAIATPPQGAQFVAAINASAGSLLFSSFVSGIQSPRAIFRSVGVDSSGNIVASGITNDGPFPTFNAFQPSPSANGSCSDMGTLLLPCSASDAIIVKISPSAGAAAALTPASVTFPPQAVGTISVAQTITIVDMGSDALTVSNTQIAGDLGDFSFQNGCTSVAAAGGTCAIQVTFTPTMLGTRTGTLTITDSSAGSPRTVQLTGQGAQASVTVSPVNLFFSVQQPGTTSSSQPVTLSNSGALALQISNVQITGPFAETNNCGSSVPATVGTCTINVTFSPTVAGAASGTLSVSDNSSGSPHTVALTGIGGTPSLGLGFAPSNGPLDLTAGSTATTELGIGGAGIGGTVTLTCSGAPTGATCSLSPSTLQVSATSASKVGLTVATTARSHILFVPPNLASWLWLVSMLGCLILLRTASANRRLRWRFVPLMALAICACGGGGGGGGTPAGSYTIVVTAKSGSTTQSFSVPLTVQ